MKLKEERIKDYTSEEATFISGCFSLLASFSIFLLALLLLTVFLSGCASPKVVMVPEVHEIHHHHTDSVHEVDSFAVERETVVMQLDSSAMAEYGIRLEKAEKAWLVRTKELERELQRIAQIKNDSVAKRDSIPYPVEVVKEVNRLYWWQKVLAYSGAIAIFMLIVGFIRRFNH